MLAFVFVLGAGTDAVDTAVEGGTTVLDGVGLVGGGMVLVPVGFVVVIATGWAF